QRYAKWKLRVAAGCSHRAIWRIKNRRGSNRSRMKLQWQVKTATRSSKQMDLFLKSTTTMSRLVMIFRIPARRLLMQSRYQVEIANGPINPPKFYKATDSQNIFWV
nr:hypothetical protein [Agrobacterium sp. rho-8.1]